MVEIPVCVNVMLNLSIGPVTTQDDYLNTVFDDVISLCGSCRNKALPWSPSPVLCLDAQPWKVFVSSGITRFIVLLERNFLEWLIVSNFIFLGQCSWNKALWAPLSRCQSRRSLMGNQSSLSIVSTELTWRPVIKLAAENWMRWSLLRRFSLGG